MISTRIVHWAPSELKRIAESEWNTTNMADDALVTSFCKEAICNKLLQDLGYLAMSQWNPVVLREVIRRLCFPLGAFAIPIVRAKFVPHWGYSGHHTHSNTPRQHTKYFHWHFIKKSYNFCNECFKASGKLYSYFV